LLSRLCLGNRQTRFAKRNLGWTTAWFGRAQSPAHAVFRDGPFVFAGFAFASEALSGFDGELVFDMVWRTRALFESLEGKL
jgi:hypothetical protein